MKSARLLNLLDIKKPIILTIRFYKLFLSPFLGNNCRFYPSCSEYAITALQQKGFFVGSAMSIWRILRCNPFSKGGYDPVIKTDLPEVNSK